MNNIEFLLADLSKDAEFKVQPFDNRFEAVVTVYATEDQPERKYRAVDSSALIALNRALQQAQVAWT